MKIELQHLLLVAYIGPDVLMPVASALAAVVGILLMFWRRTVGAARSVAGRIGSFVRRLFGRGASA